LLFGGAVSTLSAPVALAQTTAALSLDEAVARAIDFDPGLRAAGAGVDAALGTRRQARARPNPELGVEVENFAGPADLQGLDSAETTFSVSQEVEIGGKRRARVALAEREVRGAELERAIRRLDLIRDVQRAYYEALAAQEMAVIEGERLRTAEQLNASVRRRVAAARDPLMAGARAEASLAEARIALQRTEAAAATARARLASFWGGDEGFALARDAFTVPRAQPHDHRPPDDATPDVARLVAARERAGAATAVERSLAYQNPSLSLGYRRFEDLGGDGALVAGFSMPLGVFDRNQGAIARARAEERRAQLDVEAGRLAIMREFAALQRTLTADAQAVQSLEENVIPQAERALSLAQEGYNRGAFSYLDVLEAQRALSDAREARVEALLSFHSNEAAIDRLTARFAASAEESNR
jgi:cobalt-zinc-cadmium efflux system outer membrane protein